MRTRSTIPAVPAVVLILIVIAVLYYSYGNRPRDISTDINSVSEYTGDAATTTRIKTALALNKQVSGFDIHVETSNSNVTLTGRVPTENDRRFVEEIVHGTKGVTTVANNLQVDPKAQAARVER